MVSDHYSEVQTVVSVPAERGYVVRWGGVVAGVFTVVAVLGVLWQVGMAIGMAGYSVGDRAAPYMIGAGVWGVVSVILAFLAGGYVGTAATHHLHGRAGAAQGAIVWAVAGTALWLVAGMLAVSSVTAAGVTTIAAVQADPVAAAEAREAAKKTAAAELAAAGRAPRAHPELDPNAPTAVRLESALQGAGAVGWAAVVAMLLALGASVFGGFLGTRCSEVCRVEVERVTQRTTTPGMRADSRVGSVLP